MKKIALYGGAFDPPHLGHWHVAENARLSLELDEIIWLPTGHPPHRDVALASSQARYEMVNLLLEEKKAVGHTLSEYELQKVETQKTPTYFIDTLRAFKKTAPAETIFFVVIGFDSYLNFHTWHEYEAILELATLVVVPRKKGECLGLNTRLPAFKNLDNRAKEAKNEPVLLDVDPFPAASSEIRSMLLHEKKPLSADQMLHILPRNVLKYVNKYRIYENL